MKAHAKTQRRKGPATAPSALCIVAPLRESNAGARRRSNAAPTFAMLREKRRLAVLNHENGLRFTISLRDWEEVIWSVRVHPAKWRRIYAHNPYCRAHCTMPRIEIEDWLARLQLA